LIVYDMNLPDGEFKEFENRIELMIFKKR